MAEDMSGLIDSFTGLSSGGTKVIDGIEELKTASAEVKEIYSNISGKIEGLLAMIGTIASISAETQETISAMTRR